MRFPIRLILATALIAATPAEVMYTPQFLGSGYRAAALNEHGELAGDRLGTIQQAAFFDGTNWIRNGFSGSQFASSTLFDINENHFAVGFNTLPPDEDPSNSVFAVRVHLDAPFDIISLGTLTGGHGTAKARSINNLNVAVGDSLNAAGKLRAVRFETYGAVTDLGTLGGDSSTAVAINDQGVIAGESKNSADQTRGFIFRADGIMRDIGTLGGSETFVTAINNRGEIIGQSFTESGTLQAFVFANDQIQPLGTLGGNESSALGINDAGVIVGSARKANGALTPFIKYPGQPMQDLAALIPRIHQDELISARAINNRGSILAVGLNNASHYLLRPGALSITTFANYARVRFAAPGETAVLIERSFDLTNWTQHASLGVVREPFNIDFVMGTPRAFFRAKVTRPN
jgi:probable HAF family extracellular repeat protein